MNIILKKYIPYLLAIGSVLNINIQKASAYPALYYSSGNVRRSSVQACVMEAYSVLSDFGYYPISIDERRGGAAFAMASRGDTVMLVHCTNIQKYGLVTVMTASNGYISGQDPNEILYYLRKNLEQR